MPGGKHDHDHIPFLGGEFDLKKGDVIYTLTDGYQDQFGGRRGKKFKVKPMKRICSEIAHMPMDEQYKKLATTLDDWEGDLEQVDDVCIVGIRI